MYTCIFHLFSTCKYPRGKFAQIKMLNVGWFIITVRWYYTNLLSSRISAQHKITKLIWSAKIKGNIYALKPFNASCCLVFCDVGLYLQSLSFLLTKKYLGSILLQKNIFNPRRKVVTRNQNHKVCFNLSNSRCNNWLIPRHMFYFLPQLPSFDNMVVNNMND